MADNNNLNPSARQQHYDNAVAEQRERVANLVSDLEVQQELVSACYYTCQLTSCMQVMAVNERLIPYIMANSHTEAELHSLQFVIEGETMDMATAEEYVATSRQMLARSQMALQSLLDNPPYEGPMGLHAAFFPADGECSTIMHSARTHSTTHSAHIYLVGVPPILNWYPPAPLAAPPPPPAPLPSVGELRPAIVRVWGWDGTHADYEVSSSRPDMQG